MTFPTHSNEMGANAMPKDDQTVDQHVVDFVRLGQRVSRNFTVRMRNRATFDAVMAAAKGATRSFRTVRQHARRGTVALFFP
jgi:hypothetical protein